MESPSIPRTQFTFKSLNQSLMNKHYSFLTPSSNQSASTDKLQIEYEPCHHISSNYRNPSQSLMEQEQAIAKLKFELKYKNSQQIESQNYQTPHNNDQPHSISYQDAETDEEDRIYLVQYLVIIYHIDCFIDLKKTANLKHVLTSIYTNEKTKSEEFQPILQKILNFHSIIRISFKSIYKIIDYMLKDMKITEEEYNQARKNVATLILRRYSQTLSIIPRQEPEFQQYLGIRMKKSKKKVQNILSQEDNLKKIFNLFKFMKTTKAKHKIHEQQTQKNTLHKIKRRQIGTDYKQIGLIQLIQLKKDEQQIKFKMRRNYIIHSLMTEIYSKKYDVQTNDYYINSLVSQLAIHHENQLASPQTINQIQAMSKGFHLRQIEKFKGITKFITKANKKISPEQKKKVKSQLAKFFLKNWYGNLVCYVAFPNGKLFDHAQKQAAYYEKDHDLFLQDPQNLVLLNQILKDTQQQNETILKLTQASKSGHWTQEMMKKYEDFLLCQGSHNLSQKKGFTIKFMQFLVDDFSKDVDDQQLEGKTLLRIFTNLKDRWFCSKHEKGLRVSEGDMIHQQKGSQIQPGQQMQKRANKIGLIGLQPKIYLKKDQLRR